MAANLTASQSWSLTVLSQQCLVYGCLKLRMLITEYIRNNTYGKRGTRKQHAAMVEYFNELFQLTVNNQLSK